MVPTPAPVLLLSDDAALSRQIAEIAELAGVRVQRLAPTDGWPDDAAGLLIIDTACQVPQELPDWPLVRVGTGGDLQLPTDAHLLAQMFVQLGAAEESRQRGRQPILLVAGWCGGAGTSTVAREFARAAGGLLLDASGHPPSQVAGVSALSWEKIDALDPPLAAELLRGIEKVNGVLCLGPGVDDFAELDDARVAAVLSHASLPLVIDCGLWHPRVQRLLAMRAATRRPIRLVLVGRNDSESAARLAAVLAASAPLCQPCLLIRSGRMSLEMRMTTEQAGITHRTRPALRGRAARKSWTRLWIDIWEKR